MSRSYSHSRRTKYPKAQLYPQTVIYFYVLCLKNLFCFAFRDTATFDSTQKVYLNVRIAGREKKQKKSDHRIENRSVQVSACAWSSECRRRIFQCSRSFFTACRSVQWNFVFEEEAVFLMDDGGGGTSRLFLALSSFPGLKTTKIRTRAMAVPPTIIPAIIPMTIRQRFLVFLDRGPRVFNVALFSSSKYYTEVA